MSRDPPAAPHRLNVTTPNKIAANRQNALRSTGPRTPQGKAIVSQNAARGGLFASGSVLPGLESRARVRSFVEVVAKRLPLVAIEGVDTINDVLNRLTDARARLRALQRFATVTPDTLLAGRHADLVLTAIAQQIHGFKVDTFSAPEIVPDGVAWADIPDWTVDRLRRLVEAIASANDREPTQLLAAATDAARDSLNRERAAQRSFDRQVRDLRAERILPEPVPLDRMLRYESHLTRQLDQTLKQLRALQHDRHSTPSQDTSTSSYPFAQSAEDPAALIMLPLSAPERGLGGEVISSVPNPPSDPAPPSHVVPETA
jgi:hypothetical protein